MAALHRNQTRANQYQQRFQLPSNFADVLKEFTRELLRSQPEHIYGFGADYFRTLALREDGMEVEEEEHLRPPGATGGSKKIAPQPKPAAVQDEQFMAEIRTLEVQLVDAFAERDGTSSGSLAVHVVKSVLEDSVQLPAEHALYVLSGCSQELDLSTMTVDYAAFAKKSAVPIHYFSTVGHDFQPIQHENGDSVHGLTPMEIHTNLLNLFQREDVTEAGTISLHSFNDVLRCTSIGLTDRDATLLCLEASVSALGLVDYRDELEARIYPLLKLSEAFNVFDDTLGQRLFPLSEVY